METPVNIVTYTPEKNVVVQSSSSKHSKYLNPVMAGSMRVEFVFENVLLADILTSHEVWTLDSNIRTCASMFNMPYAIFGL